MTTLGIPAILEMALLSTAGRVLYSDLGKAAMSRISSFRDSMLNMRLGDNVSLALDSSRTVIASRVSNRAILIALTDKKLGIVLAKMGSVTDKFGRFLDELIALEESKAETGYPSKEVPGTTTPSPPLPAPVVEEVHPPTPPSRQYLKVPEGVAETPATVTKETEKTQEKPGTEEIEVAGPEVSLSPWAILEAASKPKIEEIMLDAEMIMLLRLVDGWKSVEVLAKESNVKLEHALKKLGLLTQEGVLKLKYDEPVYDAKPKVVGKLDAETPLMAFGVSLGKIRSLKDVLKQIDGKKTVLAIARELEINPEKLRVLLENLERRKIIEL